MNKKGFAVSGIIYSILILFLLLVFSILAILGSRKLIIDKFKSDTLDKIYGNELEKEDNIEEDSFSMEPVFFEYSGEEQSFTVPHSGYYKLEVWGAQGGTVDDGIGGYGGYSTGIVYLEEGEILYVNVGGQGKICSLNSGACTSSGGYNGGGYALSTTQTTSGGGGATHIAKESGLLSTLSAKQDQILIVAGGGGGGGYYTASNVYYYGQGGSGNGYIAQNGVDIYYGTSGYFGSGATQSSGGKPYSNGSIYTNTNGIGIFGQGGQYSSAIACCGNNGGGGGLYGGGASTRGHGGAGGGSGYIGNSNLLNKSMYCYNCSTSTAESTLTYSTTNVSETPVSEYAKQGNGHAKISYIGEKFLVQNFDYTATEQSFTVPDSGYYKLEVWGAQGGKSNRFPGGYGGYATGTIYLQENDEIFINVGGKGEDGLTAAAGVGGYNGGGNGGKSNTYTGGAGGGGATHVSFKSGILSSLESFKEQIIIVAGGGGGASLAQAGSGGGMSGSSGYAQLAAPGTQTSGYAFGSGGVGRDQAGIDGNGEGAGGGGGGYYGGYAVISTAGSTSYGGSGGSGYIGNSNLLNKSMYCYNCQTSTAESTLTYSTTNVSETPISEYAKQGNGYAKITYIGKTIE